MHFGKQTNWEFFTAKTIVLQCQTFTADARDLAAAQAPSEASTAASVPKASKSIELWWHNRCAKRDADLGVLGKKDGGSLLEALY